MLHSNSIPPTDGKNGFLRLVAYFSQTGLQCFPAGFCPPTVGNFDVSPYFFKAPVHLLNYTDHKVIVKNYWIAWLSLLGVGGGGSKNYPK